MALPLAKRLWEGALKLLVFDLIACLQGRIVALEPRHRNCFAGLKLSGRREDRVLGGREHGFAGWPRGDRGNQRRRALLLPREDDVFLRGKIVKEAAARDVGGGCDLVERGRFTTTLEEH